MMGSRASKIVTLLNSKKDIEGELQEALKALDHDSMERKEIIVRVLYTCIKNKDWSGVIKYSKSLKLRELQGVKFPSSWMDGSEKVTCTTTFLISHAITNKAPLEIVILLLEQGVVHSLIKQDDIDVDELLGENAQALEEHKRLQEILNKYEYASNSKDLSKDGLLSAEECIFLCLFNHKYGGLSSWIDIKEAMKSVFIALRTKPEELQEFINECSEYLDFEEWLFVYLNQCYGYHLNGLTPKQRIDEYKSELITQLLSGSVDKISKINKWLNSYLRIVSDVEQCILQQIIYLNAELTSPEQKGETKRSLLLDKIKDVGIDLASLEIFFRKNMQDDYVGCNDPLVLKAYFDKVQDVVTLQYIVIKLLNSIYYRIDARVLVKAAMDSRHKCQLQCLLDEAVRGITHKETINELEKRHEEFVSLDTAEDLDTAKKKELAIKFLSMRQLASQYDKFPDSPLMYHYCSTHSFASRIICFEDKVLRDMIKLVPQEDYPIIGCFIKCGIEFQPFYEEIKRCFIKAENGALENIDVLHKLVSLSDPMQAVYNKYGLLNQTFEDRLNDIKRAVGAVYFAKIINCKDDKGQTKLDWYTKLMNNSTPVGRKVEFEGLIKTLTKFGAKYTLDCPSNYAKAVLNPISNTLGIASVLLCSDMLEASMMTRGCAVICYSYLSNAPVAQSNRVALAPFAVSLFHAVCALMMSVPEVTTTWSAGSSSPIVSYAYKGWNNYLSYVRPLFSVNNISLTGAATIATSAIFYAKNFVFPNERIDKIMTCIDEATQPAYTWMSK